MLALENKYNLLLLENHKVTTEDGYILTLTRVSVPKSENSQTQNVDTEDGLYGIPASTESKREPVLICHGLICQGSHWLMNTEDKCLPYILNTAGYDCWLANLRGTDLSKEHETFSTNSRQFWDFSWDEMARYDIPAMFDYILKTTRSSRLNYIGHSMGCLTFLAALSLRPHYCSKVAKMVALAPSVYARNISNLFLKFGILFGNTVAKARHVYCRQVPLGRGTVSRHVGLICPPFVMGPDTIGAWLLSTIGVRFGMFGRGQIEQTRMPKISQNWPSTTSFKTILQMAQLYSTFSFKQYDYGIQGNLKHYGEPNPPNYNLESVQVPISVFSSDGDELCPTKDIEQAIKDLPNVTHHIHIEDSDFSHIDFMAGKDADRLVYYPIVELFQSSNPTITTSTQT